MNKLILSVVGLVAVVGLLFGIKAYEKPSQTVNTTVGAVSGPDTYFPYHANNDLRHQDGRYALSNAGTTTPLAVLSPAATSTLSQYSSCNLSVGSTTQTVITIAKATSAFATSTVLSTTTVAANAAAYLPTSTTTAVVDSAAGRLTLTDRAFAPNTYFVFGMQGGIGTFSPTGYCDLDFVY